MRERDRRTLRRYVARTAKQMGLRDWEIFVSDDEPSQPNWIAECVNLPGSRVATLRFRSTFRECEDLWQRATVIHELLHCVHAQTQDLVDVHLASVAEEDVHTIFNAAYRQANEYAIDGLAVALAPMFPPIKWGK